MIKAVVFDMDGVLLDTENIVRQAWKRAGSEFGISDAEEIYVAGLGTTRKHAAFLLRQSHGEDFPTDAFLQRTRALFYEFTAKDGIPCKSGAPEILSFLKERQIPIGLASSTAQATVERELTGTGLAPYFDMILGGDQLHNSKPAPDIYLTACEKMKVSPADALAVEDSYNGIRSAFAAGMQPVMIPDQTPATEEMVQCSLAVLPDLFALKNYLEKIL